MLHLKKILIFMLVVIFCTLTILVIKEIFHVIILHKLSKDPERSHPGHFIMIQRNYTQVKRKTRHFLLKTVLKVNKIEIKAFQNER